MIIATATEWGWERTKCKERKKTIHFQIGIACVSSHSIHIYPVFFFDVFFSFLSHWKYETKHIGKKESNTYGTLTIYTHTHTRGQTNADITPQHAIHARTHAHMFVYSLSFAFKANIFERNFWSYYTFVMCRFRNRINSWNTVLLSVWSANEF